MLSSNVKYLLESNIGISHSFYLTTGEIMANIKLGFLLNVVVSF